MRAIQWLHGHVMFIDQAALPHHERMLEIDTVDALVEAIHTLKIRGAPMLGAAGALGVALAVRQASSAGWTADQLATAVDRIRTARPTAVALAQGVDAVLPAIASSEDSAVEMAALAVVDEIADINRHIGLRGADYLGGSPEHRLRLHTHCHTGELACVEWGTALGIIRTLHERGHLAQVVVDETRPLLQGARLTAWELARNDIDFRLVCDGAGPFVIASGLVDAVVVGADRIAANGDVANKIGTYSLALAAHAAAIPFVVAAPESTIDPLTPDGASIPVEQRPESEISHIRGVDLAPAGTRAYNPAFDITPKHLVTAIVTERRVIAGDRPATTVAPRC
ncbi:MAG: S-methyl-5-thioribose-1-phosphate isomerase [Micromonosporaceae bacterium]|nr:S-methyl-5-thioribose-1-phosphate isomerase [Micromonosporaceae bacterium]